MKPSTYWYLRVPLGPHVGKVLAVIVSAVDLACQSAYWQINDDMLIFTF